MTGSHRPLEGMRLGVLGKGGSGKSTVAVLLCQTLRQRGYEVCLLDADSTNIGTHLALGITQAPRSLLDYFGGMVFSGGSVTCPVDDPTPLENAAIDLDKLPAEYLALSPSGVVLLIAGKIGEFGPGAGCDGPIAKIARDLRVEKGGLHPVTVLDLKAGFEDTARGVFTGLDWLLVVVDPSTAAMQMAVHMQNLLDKVREGARPATDHLENPDLVALVTALYRASKVRGVLGVLNRVRDSEEETLLADGLDSQGVRRVGCLEEDSRVRKAWLRGQPLPYGVGQAELELVLNALETDSVPVA
jgi:CO dehydrogenase nickel-insertion accessory protein CooC1